MAKFKITGLPKAQLGKNTTLTLSPYSVNANALALASKKFGEYNPELLLGVNQRLKSPDSKFKHDVSLDLGLPYTGKFIPSVKANYHGAYIGGKKTDSAFFPSVHSNLHLGYDPQQGLNAGLMANPRVDFANKEQAVYLKQNWPHGAWKGYAGALLGAGYRGQGFNQDVGVGDIGPESEKMAARSLIGFGLNAGFETRPFRHSPVRLGVDANIVNSLMKGHGETSQAEADAQSGFLAANTPMVKANVIYPLGTNLKKYLKKAEEQKKIDDEVFDRKKPIEPVDNTPDDGGGGDFSNENVRVKRPKREYEPISFFGEQPIGYLPGYDPESGMEVPESYTRNAYGYNQGPTMYEDGGYIDIDLDENEIEDYRRRGYIVEELPQAQLGQSVSNDVGYRTATEDLQGLIKQRDSDLSYAKTAAQKDQVNKQYAKLIADATARQNASMKTANQAGAKQVKKIITTSDKAAQIKKDKLAKEKAQAEMYAAELAKNNGEIPYYEDLSKQNQIADNTVVDKSYFTLPAQQLMQANALQDYNTKQQQEYYKSQLAQAKYAQEKGFDNAYAYKYNPAGAFADKKRKIDEENKGLLYYDNNGKPVFTKSGLQRQTDKFLQYHMSPMARIEMNDGALQGVDWMWTLPFAAPAALEGLGALASTSIPYTGGLTLGTAADAAFAIQGADQIYQGNKALQQANAMPDDTYEQKLAKLQAQNKAYSDIGWGAAGVLPLGINKLTRGKGALANEASESALESQQALQPGINPRQLPAAQASKVPFKYQNSQVFDDVVQEMRNADNIGGFNPIQYADEASYDPWYNIDPADYRSAEEANKVGRQDSFKALNKYTTNMLPSKDPGFMSDLNAAKFRLQTGLDSPVGTKFGILPTRWRGVDIADLDIPTLEQMKEFNIDPRYYAFSPYISNETLLNSAQRNMLRNIEGAQQGALNRGDQFMFDALNDAARNTKRNALSDYKFEPYTGADAMSTTVFNATEPLNTEINTTTNILADYLSRKKAKNLAPIQKPLDDLFNREALNQKGQWYAEDNFKKWHDQKLLDYQTPEGQRRIQKFIDDNYPVYDFPGMDRSISQNMDIADYMSRIKNLKYNDVTKPIIDKIDDDFNKVIELKNKIDNLENTHAELLKNPSSSLDEIDLVDAEIEMFKHDLNRLTDEITNKIKKINSNNDGAHYNTGTNAVFFGNKYLTPQDIEWIMAHEGTHGVTNTSHLDSVNSKMDRDLINELKLSKTLPKHLAKEQSIDEINSTPSGVSQALAINKAKDPEYYWKSAKQYWEAGGKRFNTQVVKGMSSEPTAFIAEVRAAMKKDGIIKNDFDPISEDMLKEYYNQYINTPIHHKALRVFDIMDNKKSNFKVLEKHINDLLGLAPYLVPTAIGVGAASATLPEEKDGGIYLELDEDEIKAYRDGGYIVEDLD